MSEEKIIGVVELSDLVATYVTATLAARQSAQRIKATRQSFDAFYAPQLAQMSVDKVNAASAEAALRRSVETYFEQTGDKHPLAGVNVQEVRSVHYDVAQATEWARQNAPGLLALDTAAYEKVFGTLPGMPGEEVLTPRVTLSPSLVKDAEEKRD
jgi:hypothetical protein